MPLLSPYEAEVALGAQVWQAQYPMDYYAKAAGPWGNYASEAARRECEERVGGCGERAGGCGDCGDCGCAGAAEEEKGGAQEKSAGGAPVIGRRPRPHPPNKLRARASASSSACAPRVAMPPARPAADMPARDGGTHSTPATPVLGRTPTGRASLLAVIGLGDG